MGSEMVRAAIRVVGTAALLALLVIALVGNQHPLAEGTPAPAARVRWLDGRVEDVRFTGFTVVNIWATWCPPCVAEMPELSRVSERYRGRARFVGLAAESNQEDVVRLTERIGVKYEIGQIGNATSTAWGATALPSTYIVDPQGKIAWSIRGQLDERTLTSALDHILQR